MGKHLSQGEKEYIFNSAGSLTDKDLAAKLTEIRGSTVNKEVVGAFRRRLLVIEDAVDVGLSALFDHHLEARLAPLGHRHPAPRPGIARLRP